MPVTAKDGCKDIGGLDLFCGCEWPLKVRTQASLRQLLTSNDPMLIICDKLFWT